MCGCLIRPDIAMLCTVCRCRSGDGGVHSCEEIGAGRVAHNKQLHVYTEEQLGMLIPSKSL
eukprot:10050060-Ditylum_brightwellii.AAC.1